MKTFEALIIDWQGKALKLYTGQRTKDLMARAAVYEQCAADLLEVLEEHSEPIAPTFEVGDDYEGPVTVSPPHHTAPTTANES